MYKSFNKEELDKEVLKAKNIIGANTALNKLGIVSPNNSLKDIQAPMQTNDMQTQPVLKQLATQPVEKTFKSTLGNGITYEGDLQGNRKYTMGTPGQDGYGSMIVRPGAAQQNNIGNNINNGYEINGLQEDVNKFNKPVMNPGNPAPDALNGGSLAAMLEQQSAKQRLADIQQPPKYMTKEERMQAGIGWKSALGKYNQDMETYNKITGNQNALDIEKMREAGVANRTLAQANQWNAENVLNAKKINKDSALADTQNQIGQLALRQEQNLQAAKDDYIKNPSAENKNKLNALLYDPKKQVQTDTKVIDQFDPLTGNKIGQIVVRDDGTGNYVDAMKPQQNQQSQPQSQEHPATAYLRANDNPENRALFIKRYGKLPDGFK